MRDPYTVLGVAKDSSDDDIKKAYRKLAKKYHPDLNPGNKDVEKRFKELTQANDIIGDPVKRKKYDQGEIDSSGNDRNPFYRGARRGASGGAGFDPFKDFDPQDIFADIFNMAKNKSGGGGESFKDAMRSAGKTRGADINYALRIGFIEAAKGAKRRISIGNDDKTIEVTIPPGTTDGQMLRLKGQGKAGQSGGENGDAFIEVHVDPDPNYEVKGINLFMDLPITLPEAVLGATITVSTIDGPVSLVIPKGANTGNNLRLKGKGLVDQKTKIRGDQYVRLKIVLPDKIDKDLREFAEEWGAEYPYKVRP